MPYIKKEYRKILNKPIDDLWEAIIVALPADRPGCITYAIYRLLLCFSIGVHYHTFATLLGILESAKHEFYRKKIAPYEDKKIQENGEVTI